MTTPHDKQTAQASGRQIAFIDLEASGLGPKSWPIEIGWGFVGWPVRSMLIKPSENWSLEAWEKSAEDLHGISPDILIREGTPPLEAALVLNAAFNNADVYSDAPDYDGFWLYRLYEAAGVRANFKLLDLSSLLEPLATSSPAELVAKAQAKEPHTHRAGQDVRHMQVLYQLACEEAAQ
jgi:hypothetical protein